MNIDGKLISQKRKDALKIKIDELNEVSLIGER